MTKKARATEEQLGGLHGEVAETLGFLVRNAAYKVVPGEHEDEDDTVLVNDKVLRLAIDFLAKNGMKCLPTADNPIGRLQEAVTKRPPGTKRFGVVKEFPGVQKDEAATG